MFLHGPKDDDRNHVPLKDRDPAGIHKNGLTNAENVIANDLIKAKLKTIPDITQVPEDADYSIIEAERVASPAGL